MQVARIGLPTMLRISLPLALISIVVLMPLEFAWWKLIGYFG